MTDRVEHEAYFATNRTIWLSLLPKETIDAQFPGAKNPLAKKLVTASIFSRKFWNDNFVNLDREERDITAERAWFGIRSFIKGSRIANDVHKNGLDETMFAQLVGEIEGKEQIHRKETDAYFLDPELHTMISIYRKYSHWMENGDRYDEMDIVRAAIEHNQQRENPNKELKVVPTKLRTQLAKKVNLSNEDIVWKKDALRKTRSPKMTEESANKMLEFLNNWRKNKTVDGYRVYRTKEGIILYKARLADGIRFIFSVTRVGGYNIGTHEENLPILIIYDIVFDHDEFDQALKDLVKKMEGERYNDDEIRNINLKTKTIVYVKSFNKTPGQGPVKPIHKLDKHDSASAKQIFVDVDLPHNIILDEHQRDSVVDHQPLLIDGLAGTGKTAVLSRRGAIRLGFSGKPAQILFLASTNTVVDRLAEDLNFLYQRQEYWEEMDRLFNLEIIGIENDYTNTSRTIGIQQIIDHPTDFIFDEIILDECQDITPLEFQCLKFMVYSDGKDVGDTRRFTFAGDPLQTLNPTGFDWNRIKSLFVNSMAESDEEKRKIASSINITRLHTNYRSQKHIVELANSIQRHRHEVIRQFDDIEMGPYLPEKIEPYLVSIDSKNDQDITAVKKVLSESSVGHFIVICWAADDYHIIELCTAENETRDKLLSDLWSEKKVEDIYAFQKQLNIHSSTSIKGGEHKTVVLYKFGSHHKSMLDSLQTEFKSLEPCGKEDKITTAFAYSRLYVAVTRAFDNIYFVEDKTGIEFWNDVKLLDIEGNLITQSFNHGPAHELLETQDFIIEDEISDNMLKEYEKDWNDNKNYRSLLSAIRCASYLFNKTGTKEYERALYELEGDDHKTRAMEQDDEEERLLLLEKAIDFYRKAGKNTKVRPLLYLTENWIDLKQQFAESTQSFDRLMSWYSSVKLKETLDCSLDLFRETYNEWKLEHKIPKEWRDDLSISEANNLFNLVKDNFVKNYAQKSTNLDDLIEINSVELFGFETIRKNLEKWIEGYPNKYLDYIDRFSAEDGEYQTQNDRGYAKALQARLDRLETPEQIRNFINERIEFVHQDKKMEWIEKRSESIFELVKKLPKSSARYDTTKKGVPVYLLDSEYNAKGNNVTEQLFSLLFEEFYACNNHDDLDEDIEGYTSFSKGLKDNFVQKYGSSRWLLLNLKKDGNPINCHQVLSSLHESITWKENPNLLEQVDWIDDEVLAEYIRSFLDEKNVFKIYGDLGQEENPCMTIDLLRGEIFDDLNEIYSNKTAIFRNLLSIGEYFHNNNLLKKYNLFGALAIGEEGFGTIKSVVKEQLAQIINAIKNKHGHKSYKNLKQLIHIYIEEMFDGKSEVNDNHVNLLDSHRNLLDDQFNSYLDIIKFRQLKSGMKLMNEINKSDDKITRSTLQPYIDMLKQANRNDMVDELTKRIKLEVQDTRDKLMQTEDADKWLEFYLDVKPNISVKDKLLTVELLIDLLEKTNFDQQLTINDKLHQVWKDFLQQDKTKFRFDFLVKIVDNLSIEKSLNIYKITPVYLCGLAIGKSTNRNDIIATHKPVFKNILVQNMAIEMSSYIQPAKPTQSQIEKQQNKSKSLQELLSKVAVDNDNSYFGHLLVWVLNKITTNAIDDLKDELDITGGAGNKSAKVKKILEFIKIEWNEEFDQIIELSK